MTLLIQRAEFHIEVIELKQQTKYEMMVTPTTTMDVIVTDRASRVAGYEVEDL